MADIKKTKAMYFAELRTMVENWVDKEDQDDLLEFIDREVEILNKRKTAAQNRAAKKKVESDALTDEVFEQITDELASVDEIVLSLNMEGVTRNKVTARLGKLVKEGKIEKEVIKVDGKRRMAYRLPTNEEVEK